LVELSQVGESRLSTDLGEAERRSISSRFPPLASIMAANATWRYHLANYRCHYHYWFACTVSFLQIMYHKGLMVEIKQHTPSVKALIVPKKNALISSQNSKLHAITTF